MAETTKAVWGIDIGQAGVKANKLRAAEAADQLLAVAFDNGPHAKILSQPDAIPEELIPQAIETFLSRNDVDGDLVAISVPGQTALTRFIQLPPVESSKVAEIVKYEARQQIPFALEDVIWDYQPLGGGIEEGGYMLEAEIGLFAMKREQVLQHLRPFADRKIEVELIQVAPLALHNFVCYDRLGVRPDDDFPGMDEHTVLIDMGADNTTLLVTNGAKIWIRNVPIGGNHFTRALTKEMKLTFAKAEHLKCNATKSPDPRAVFQALRPVFNDYVAEIQRSIGYFSSVNRDAKVARVLGMGNGFKLAGLQKFLQQNLQYDVERVEVFDALAGESVLSSPLFQENILSFAVPYGLAIQTLGLGQIRTSLLPPEIATARKVRRKKPWAVATAATLLAGLAMSAAGYSAVARSVSVERFGGAESTLQSVKSELDGYKSSFGSAEGEFDSLIDEGKKLTKPLSDREYWFEIYRAINECLPRDHGDAVDEMDITKRHRMKLPIIVSEKVDNLGKWFESLPTVPKDRMLPEDKEKPPEGEGYVFTLEGVHYHHDESKPRTEVGDLYVVNTLLNNLQSWTMKQEGSTLEVPVRQIGISHATIVRSYPRVKVKFYPLGQGPRVDYDALSAGRGRFGADPTMAPDAGAFEPRADGFGAAPGGARRGGGLLYAAKGLSTRAQTQPTFIEIPQTKFTIQFVWKPIPKEERQAEPPSAGAAEGAGDEAAEAPAASE